MRQHARLPCRSTVDDDVALCSLAAGSVALWRAKATTGPTCFELKRIDGGAALVFMFSRHAWFAACFELPLSPRRRGGHTEIL